MNGPWTRYIKRPSGRIIGDVTFSPIATDKEAKAVLQAISGAMADLYAVLALPPWLVDNATPPWLVDDDPVPGI